MIFFICTHDYPNKNMKNLISDGNGAAFGKNHSTITLIKKLLIYLVKE